MTYSDVGLIASIVMIILVVIDWKCGVTGLGRLKLRKESSPEKFWMALGLYLNMAFLLFWLSGRSYEAATEGACDLSEGPCTVILDVEEEPQMMIDIDQATRP